MKATGIVRKIDDLGRVVIPKEIRKNLRIREGDPLEIYVDEQGEVILKKYAPMGEFLELSEKYTETLAKITGFAAAVSDTNMIIAASGISKKDYLDKEISNHILNLMEERTVWYTKDDNIIPILQKDDTSKYYSQIIAPIIVDGDVIGTVIMFSTDYKKKVTDTELKLVQTATTFLSKQMEI